MTEFNLYESEFPGDPLNPIKAANEELIRKLAAEEEQKMFNTPHALEFSACITYPTVRPLLHNYTVKYVPRRVAFWRRIRSTVLAAWFFIRALRIHDSRNCHDEEWDD